MINAFKKFFGSFITIESFSGLLLLGVASLAMYMANSPLQSIYETINHFVFSLKLGPYLFQTNFHEIINDALMALFFFVVGMEIKVEFLEGELSSPKKIALPLMAAIGGSIVPAAIYYYFNQGLATEVGWGIPMATDIAFAIGVLSLASRRVPFALKVFLLCLAIIDDILAVLVIALFYSESIGGPFLALALLICFSIWVYFKLNIHNTAVLIFLSIALWVSIYNSGIHATLSGIILGFLIPYRKRYTEKQILDMINRTFVAGKELGVKKINELRSLIHHAESPLNHIITTLHPYVSYIIIPLFAFSNAGVTIKEVDAQFWSSNISYGIILGLCLGKPIGITLFAFLSRFLRISQLPEGVNWKQIIGVGFLGGIGFTMSLFITNLSFEVATKFHSTSKLSILIASAFCGLIGLIILMTSPKLPKHKTKKQER